MRWSLIKYYLYLDQVMNSRTVRRVYLITYRFADLTKFPSWREFGDAVADALNFGASLVRVEYWACCLEKHASLSNSNYFMSAKKYWRESCIIDFMSAKMEFVSAIPNTQLKGVAKRLPPFKNLSRPYK